MASSYCEEWYNASPLQLYSSARLGTVVAAADSPFFLLLDWHVSCDSLNAAVHFSCTLAFVRPDALVDSTTD